MSCARRFVRGGLLASAAVITVACGLRQNLRNEFLSFRGAWFCAEAGCTQAQMKEADRGTDEGGTKVLYGTLQPAAALVFNAGAEVESFTASVADCNGKRVTLPDAALQAPGEHAIAGQPDCWVVTVDREALSELQLDDKGKCGRWVVTAKATWPKGTTYEDRGAVEQR